MDRVVGILKDRNNFRGCHMCIVPNMVSLFLLTDKKVLQNHFI